MSNIYILKLSISKMDTTVLQDLGFSHTEIKVFLTILQLGETKANEIIKKSNLQSSSAYYAINSLIDKGFISYIKKSKIKYYKAADPSTILDYIELKKNDYLKLLPELKDRQKQSNQEQVEYYKSYKGIKTIISEMLKDAKRGDTYRTFSVENPEEYEIAIKKVFAPTKQLFKQKGIKQKGIFHIYNKKKRTKTTIIQKKYLNIPMPPNTMVLNDNIAIISWDKEPSGVLIKSKNIAKQYSDFFEALWKIAKR